MQVPVAVCGVAGVTVLVGDHALAGRGEAAVAWKKRKRFQKLVFE